MKVGYLPEIKWVEFLQKVIVEYEVTAPVKTGCFSDYSEISMDNVGKINYTGNTTTTPLKVFFFPFKENVMQESAKKMRVLLGVSNCDLVSLDLLDNIYLGGELADHCYKEHRANTIVIGKDCDEIKDSCHCVSYGLKPYSEKNCDVSLSVSDGYYYLLAMSDKGEAFLDKFGIYQGETLDSLPDQLIRNRNAMIDKLNEQNKDIPDEKASRSGILRGDKEIWKKHASRCVSCGACSLICPTCHCFLLTDRHDFEKVKNWDVCQLPGFSRVAAGEDPLEKLGERLKERYLCKFVYKPDMFHALACTGCGRCIDACIGKINKNEVVIEVCQQG
ncbi:MAG: 4Fe-4S dicluster domain-containing protein [Candidatus Cloacimonadaceae bacterium]|nr:4Fe-4S dicluster domain-containing protein [Candidatus Cloacimonadaceae bacterium]